jgi:hypothetical protein
VLNAYQKVWIVVRFRNNGSAIWNNSGPGAVHLTTADANNAFCDTTDTPAWINCARPAGMTEASVGPGGTATFSFWYAAPTRLNLGDFATRLGLVSETVAPIAGDQPTVYTRVPAVYYAENNSSIAVYTDQSMSQTASLSNLQSAQKVWVVISFRNNGSAIWKNTGVGAVHLATADGNDPFCDTTDTPAWINCARPAGMTEASMGPGGVGTFGFWYKAPAVAAPTDYATTFQIVSEAFSSIPGDHPVLYTHVTPN